MNVGTFGGKGHEEVGGATLTASKANALEQQVKRPKGVVYAQGVRE